AQLLAEKGYKLILVARRVAKLEALAAELGVDSYIAEVDVRDRQAVSKFFTDIPTEFQDIDVLVNNAGLARGLEVAAESNLDDWEEMVATNINGVLYFTREALAQMQKRNSGQIINIGSVAGSVPYKGGNVYGATKAFVRQFSRNLRADLAGTD